MNRNIIFLVLSMAVQVETERRQFKAERRRRASLLLILVVASVLGACASPLVPVDAPAPFSPALQRYLDSAEVGRAEVVRWLGEPDVQRRGGALLFWLAFREMAYNPPFPIRETQVEHHVLMVSLDDAGQVAAHDVVINGGCSDRIGVCVATNHRLGDGNNVWIYGDVESFRLVMVDLLTVLEPEPGDDPVGASAPSGKCRVTAYRGSKRAGEALRLEMPELGARSLPVDGYIRWYLPAESTTLKLEWAVGVSGFQPRWDPALIEVPCGTHDDVYLQFDFERGGFRPMVITHALVPAEEARGALSQKRRVLLE